MSYSSYVWKFLKMFITRNPKVFSYLCYQKRSIGPKQLYLYTANILTVLSTAFGSVTFPTVILLYIVQSKIVFDLNPKQAKGGRNQDAACLDTLPVQ